MTNKEINEFIDVELKQLSRSIVATPTSRENLDSFATSNMGSMDTLLTQMAVQYGYELALTEIKEIIN